MPAVDGLPGRSFIEGYLVAAHAHPSESSISCTSGRSAIPMLKLPGARKPVGLIPTRYPNSETSDDNQIRLSRLTSWREFGPGGYQGLGQRMIATDTEEYPLMDVRKIVLDAPPPSDTSE